MDDRQNSGRRAGDALFSRGVKIAGSIGGFAVVAITLAFKLYAQAQDFPAVKADVAELKIAQTETKATLAVLAYISCVTFSEKHPQNEVPALCAQSVRNGR